MAAFKGHAVYAVDKKGRVAIPARMRAAMRPEDRSSFTLTRGFENCIVALPQDAWVKIETQISNLNTYDRQARAFTRLFMMWAEEAALDKQGRVKLPAPLIAHANIGSQALILGAHDRIEIWSPEEFEAYQTEQGEQFETLAAQVMGG